MPTRSGVRVGVAVSSPPSAAWLPDGACATRQRKVTGSPSGSLVPLASRRRALPTVARPAARATATGALLARTVVMALSLPRLFSTRSRAERSLSPSTLTVTLA